MLELIDLSKRYKDQYAVKSMNMYIEKGEIIGLLGPNGAGKSTTISMLSTLIEPTEGDVIFKKKSILKNPSPLRKVTGVVPQEIALYEDFSAEENLTFFGKTYHLSKKVLRKRIDEVLQLIGLEDRRKGIVKTFSGGMKRRLNIGVAMLHEPEVLILDEPTVGIDPQSRYHILNTVKQLNQEQNVTTIYTSHYMEEVEFLCNRIYIMDDGKLIAAGTKEEIKSIMSSEQTCQIELGIMNQSFKEKLHQTQGIREVTSEKDTITIIVSKDIKIFPLITQLAQECEVSLISVQMKSPTLEDVFMHLTGRALRDAG